MLKTFRRGKEERGNNSKTQHQQRKGKGPGSCGKGRVSLSEKPSSVQAIRKNNRERGEKKKRKKGF